MQEYIYLISGAILLLLVIYDFFFTTLSGSGAGPISDRVSTFSDKVIKVVVKAVGRSAFKLNGLFVNLMMLFIWILLVWLGLFLLYSWNPEAITNSNGRTANALERLYYTGYIISTLGIGNFKPTSGFFEIITSFFAFFGFIFFTSSMTYFISVSSALVNKRVLARTVFSLGQDPEQIAHKLLSLDSSYSYQQLLNLQEMIDRHSVNHQAYPVIHFYTEAKPKNSFSLNLTRLDEALSILSASKEGRKLREEVDPLRSSIGSFLENLETSFSKSMPTVSKPVDSARLPYEEGVPVDEEQKKRRRVLEELFTSEGFRWNDIV